MARKSGRCSAVGICQSITAQSVIALPQGKVFFAMVRDKGRILDDFKCVVRGTDILEADFELSKIFNNLVIGAHTIRMQRWPRDLDLRKGLLSGNWADISTIVSCRDSSVFDNGGACLAKAVHNML